MKNNIDLILAQLHMEEEELLLVVLVFVQFQQESLKDADRVVEEDGGLNPSEATLWTI